MGTHGRGVRRLTDAEASADTAHNLDVMGAAETFPAADAQSRRHARQILELRGLEVVQASNGIAALELIQRLPRRFRVVLTELDLPGISGAVLSETLHLFRPDLPTFCMSSRAGAGAVEGQRCLVKPLQGPDLQAALENGGSGDHAERAPAFPETWVARARARYAAAGDLVEAALELARAAGP